MSATTLRGRTGELRGQGRVAAVLGAWRLEGTAEAWRLEARVEAADAYLLGRGARELRLRVGRHTRRWRAVDAEVVGDSLAARGSGEGDIL